MPAELQTCKPRPKPAPYQQKPQEKDLSQTGGAPATSAKSIKTKTCRENLTLNDWLTVVAFIDSHPDVGEERYQFEDEAAIVVEVQHQMAVEQGNIVEIELDDGDTQPCAAPVPHSEILEMCEKLEMICMSESDANTSLELPQLLRKFHEELHQKELLSAKQTMLNNFWKS